MIDFNEIAQEIVWSHVHGTETDYGDYYDSADVDGLRDAIAATLRDVEAAAYERAAQSCDATANKLEAESKRTETIEKGHSKYCQYLAYHARQHAAAIRALPRQAGREQDERRQNRQQD